MAVNPKIQKYYDDNTALLDTLSTDIDSLVNSLSSIQGDEKFLKDTIDKLQNSPGAITPEDQALLDQLQARVNQLGGNVTAAKNVAAALDSAVENVPTPPPPTP